MHPYLLRIRLPWGGVFPIASYGTMLLIGFLVGLWLLLRRGRRVGLDPAALFDGATFMLLGGIVGSRLFYVLDHWSNYADNPISIIRIDQGGLAFFGGLIGGGAALLATIYARRLPLLTTLDVAASIVPISHAFGRVGCFLNGCCYGKVTSCWTGVSFPRVLDESGELIGCPAYQDHLLEGLVQPGSTHSLPVHPTQLYEVSYNLVIFAVLTWWFLRRRRPGDVAWLYLVLYGCARFTNEFFRADNPGIEWLGGLSVFHAIAGTGAVAGVLLLVRSSRRPRVPLPEPWQPPPQADAAS